MDDHRGVTDSLDTAPTPDTPPSTRRLRRLGVGVVVLSFVGIWGYVLYLSIFVGRADLPDRLEDTGWVESAEATCAPTAAAVARLPFANEVDDPAERGELLDRATDELAPMVNSLRGLVAPAEPEEARAVGRWLDDWDVYIQDRREYADRFRAGEDAAFTVTDRGGYQIDVLLDDFAVKANDMPSCAPPDDVG